MWLLSCCMGRRSWSMSPGLAAGVDAAKLTAWARPSQDGQYGGGEPDAGVIA